MAYFGGGVYPRGIVAKGLVRSHSEGEPLGARVARILHVSADPLYLGNQRIKACKPNG